MDVRAPVEFTRGAFPNTQNHPLMSDNERAQVGTCYKQRGQQAAIELGKKLVSEQLKQQRVNSWRAFYQAHPDGYFYCFRGGLRSRITQTWMCEAGFDLPFIEGGYKAMRQFLIEVIEQAGQRPMLIVCGKTGCGKTEYIHSRKDAIDLEGIANHRGSSFGESITPQPTQINFENQLAVALLNHQADGHDTLVLEDESYLIGRSAIPGCFYQAMQAASVMIIEASLDERMRRIADDYVIKTCDRYIQRFGEAAGFDAFANHLLNSVDKIQKRLGGQLHRQIRKILLAALKEQRSQGEVALYFDAIRLLLEKYYDPMYEYQLNRKLTQAGS